MKIWIIAAIVIGLLIVGTAIAIASNSGDSEEEYTAQTCPNYNTCSQANNCGRETCGAIQGKSCGCGK